MNEESACKWLNWQQIKATGLLPSALFTAGVGSQILYPVPCTTVKKPS